MNSLYEIFKTTVILSIIGFSATTLLLIIKPITVKKLPAKWQYCVWVAVLISMIFPAYKFIPQKQAQRVSHITAARVEPPTVKTEEKIIGETPSAVVKDTPFEYREIKVAGGRHIGIYDLICIAWLTGTGIFAAVVLASYVIYVIKLRKNSQAVENCELLASAKAELNIKRKIRLRKSDEPISPMLVGVLRPTVYIPSGEIAPESMRMILLHELTHCKRCDLVIKWLAAAVNAVHWFNPLAYILCANISEACEISCDMSVTKNMTDDEQKIYMKTILDLAQERRK